MSGSDIIAYKAAEETLLYVSGERISVAICVVPCAVGAVSRWHSGQYEEKTNNSPDLSSWLLTICDIGVVCALRTVCRLIRLWFVRRDESRRKRPIGAFSMPLP